MAKHMKKTIEQAMTVKYDKLMTLRPVGLTWLHWICSIFERLWKGGPRCPMGCGPFWNDMRLKMALILWRVRVDSTPMLIHLPASAKLSEGEK